MMIIIFVIKSGIFCMLGKKHDGNWKLKPGQQQHCIFPPKGCKKFQQRTIFHSYPT